jgi:hypothetical protein
MRSAVKQEQGMLALSGMFARYVSFIHMHRFFRYAQDRACMSTDQPSTARPLKGAYASATPDACTPAISADNLQSASSCRAAQHMIVWALSFPLSATIGSWPAAIAVLQNSSIFRLYLLDNMLVLPSFGSSGIAVRFCRLCIIDNKAAIAVTIAIAAVTQLHGPCHCHCFGYGHCCCHCCFHSLAANCALCMGHAWVCI